MSNNACAGGKSNLSTHISTPQMETIHDDIHELSFSSGNSSSVWIPYDLLNTCLQLAFLAPLLFPVPVSWAPVSSPCLTVSHPSSLSSDALSPTAKRKRKYYWHRCSELQEGHKKNPQYVHMLCIYVIMSYHYRLQHFHVKLLRERKRNKIV